MSFQADYLKERAAYLEVVIGRALARCGNPDGAVILINYLNGVRTILAEHAHDHLVAVIGVRRSSQSPIRSLLDSRPGIIADWLCRTCMLAGPV